MASLIRVGTPSLSSQLRTDALKVPMRSLWWGASAAHAFIRRPGIIRAISSSSDSDVEDVEGLPLTAARVVECELMQEALDSYMSYSCSVIVGRALPDVRDGLKPVHRRILYAMHDMGLTAKKPHRKCARVVGEVLGKYHPHGDTAVYDALVRMAQDFYMRMPLVSGHGNFGSLDADPAAAMRYTEARLGASTQAMLLNDLHPSAVDYIPTFDGSEEEPAVMPACVPNLLVNGTAGIAVGIATKIPPHNLREVLGALRHLIGHPDCSVADLMAFMPGPDFPTGGVVLSGPGIESAYATGNGGIQVRGAVTIEDATKRRRAAKTGGPAPKQLIVVNEVPYQVNKADLVASIAKLVEEGKLQGVADVRDESDRNGVRMVVECKRGVSAEMVLKHLYKHTRLQISFSCNMVALVDGQPRSLPLKAFLNHWKDFRCEVIVRRSQHALQVADTRLHLVQGFLAAMGRMDEVVRLIRSAADGAAARGALMGYLGLSREQADGVLDLNLRRLTSLETDTLQAEEAELQAKISSLNSLINDPDRVLEVVLSEADTFGQKFGDDRRTKIVSDDSGDILEDEVVPNRDSIITYSARGYIKRMSADTFALQKRGGKGKAGAKLRGDDSLAELLTVKDHDDMFFFTTNGKVFSLKAHQVPENSRTAVGTSISQLLRLAPDDRTAALLSLPAYDPERFMVLLTRKGLVKIVPQSEFEAIKTNGKIAMKLGAGDQLLTVATASVGDVISVASSSGRLISFEVANLTPRSRIAGGVSTMKLKADRDDEIVDMAILPVETFPVGEEGDAEAEDAAAAGPWWVMVSSGGYGKRVPCSAFRVSKSRTGLGLVGMKLREGDRLASLHVHHSPEDELVMATALGVVNRIKLSTVRVLGRTGQGSRLIKTTGAAPQVVQSTSVQVSS